jgi:hypothetical protein
MTEPVSRRVFLKVAGAGAAAVAIGTVPAARSAPIENLPPMRAAWLSARDESGLELARLSAPPDGAGCFSGPAVASGRVATVSVFDGTGSEIARGSGPEMFSRELCLCLGDTVKVELSYLP